MSKSVSILLVGKLGDIKETEIKAFDQETLYKKAGFKTADSFAKQSEWGIEIEGAKYNIVLYAKTSGRAGQENKYEFPPPVDTNLFFGTAVLINTVDNQPVSLFKEEWKKIYEALYGGFEDIEEESEEESEDDSEDDVIPKTKEGYAKDGFIVDDDEVEDDEYSSEEDISEINDSSEEEEKPKKKTAKKPATKPATRNATKTPKSSVMPIENTVISTKTRAKPATRSGAKKSEKQEQTQTQTQTSNQNNENSYLNCESELEMEEFV